MAAPGLAALAKVVTGWTGSIAVTAGGRTVTVTPRTRESVASLFARLIADCLAELSGFELLVSLVSADQLQMSSADGSTFSVTMSGNCGTWTDFDSGPYSGANVYGSDGNGFLGAFVATYGMRCDSLGIMTGQGRATADGTAGYAPPLEAPDATLILFGQFDEVWSLETSALGVYDLWHDGRVQARLLIDVWRRVAPGQRRTGMMRLEAQASVVSE